MAGSGDLRRQRGDLLGVSSVNTDDPEPDDAGPADTDAGDHPAGDAAADGGRGDRLLHIDGLSLGFDDGQGGITQVLDRVELTVGRGEIMGLVGESGCGKTVTAQSILRLLPSPPARILGGRIDFDGTDLLRLSARELRTIRGNRIAMIFQDPMASLNPAFTIGDQIVEAQRLHADVSKRAARDRATELLDLVGIPAATKRLDDFPHTFSGGMRQRVLIAMALANDPELLIADEPTTALDVTVQAQIVELIAELRDTFSMSVLFVTHDLGVVQDLCDRVTVMYAGQVVESSPVEGLLSTPRHPYAAALLDARPRLRDESTTLASIPAWSRHPRTCPPAVASPSAADTSPTPVGTTPSPWRP